MTDRARLVYALLRTLMAWAPAPRSRMGLDKAMRGFVPPTSRYVTCPDCLANDKPQGMPGCETCNGRGEIPDPAKDPYDTGKALGTFAGRVQLLHRAATDDDAKRARRERDLELDRLAQQTATFERRDEEPPPPDPLTNALDQRDRLYRKGSYRQLEMALARLRRLDPPAYTLAMSVAYQPFGEAPIDPEAENVIQVCELLGVWIDGPIVVPDSVPISTDAEVERVCREGRGALWWGRRDWHRLRRDERKALIVAMRADGASLQKIGLRFNLTRQRVKQILDDHGEGVATGPAA